MLGSLAAVFTNWINSQSQNLNLIRTATVMATVMSEVDTVLQAVVSQLAKGRLSAINMKNIKGKLQLFHTINSVHQAWGVMLRL